MSWASVWGPFGRRRYTNRIKAERMEARWKGCRLSACPSTRTETEWTVMQASCCPHHRMVQIADGLGAADAYRLRSAG